MQITRFFVLTSTIFLMACSTSTTEKNKLTPDLIAENAGYEIIESVKRISDYKIDGWHYISPSVLKISAGVRGEYLIILQHSCHGLRDVEVIGTTSTGNSLSKFESVIIKDRVMGKETCPINGLYKIKKKAH